MKFIHISENFRRDSISKKGLLPSKVRLDHHLNYFKNQHFLKEDEDKMLYTWLSSEKDNKFIKDMVYCKMWIEPRNNFCLEYNPELKLDMSVLPHNILSWTPYTNMIFDVYEISNLNVLNDPDLSPHCQEPADSYSSLVHMDDTYAHDDKLLGFSKTPEANFKIIKQAFVNVDKNGKLDIRIR